MAQEDISAIIVTVEGKAKGIVTERDILKRIVADDKNARKTKLKENVKSLSNYRAQHRSGRGRASYV